MSIVPNDDLKSVDSLDMQTFGVTLQIDTSMVSIDTLAQYRGYWKSCIIRNYQLSSKLEYRTAPYEPLKLIQPNSELPIKGWGSYMEIRSGAVAPKGLVEFEVVNMYEAKRNA